MGEWIFYSINQVIDHFSFRYHIITDDYKMKLYQRSYSQINLAGDANQCERDSIKWEEIKEKHNKENKMWAIIGITFSSILIPLSFGFVFISIFLRSDETYIEGILDYGIIFFPSFDRPRPFLIKMRGNN